MFSQKSSHFFVTFWNLLCKVWVDRMVVCYVSSSKTIFLGRSSILPQLFFRKKLWRDPWLVFRLSFVGLLYEESNSRLCSSVVVVPLFFSVKEFDAPHLAVRNPVRKIHKRTYGTWYAGVRFLLLTMLQQRRVVVLVVAIVAWPLNNKREEESFFPLEVNWNPPSTAEEEALLPSGFILKAEGVNSSLKVLSIFLWSPPMLETCKVGWKGLLSKIFTKNPNFTYLGRTIFVVTCVHLHGEKTL